MKVNLLPSTIDEKGVASQRQHLSCILVDDCLAVDAGSLAIASSTLNLQTLRNVVLTHAHLDHIAGLPLYIDDLFATIDEPIKIYGTLEMIETLREHIFNWKVYPDFEELENDYGRVLEFCQFEANREFKIDQLSLMPIQVNHKVDAVGFVISDAKSTVAISGDTASTNDFWEVINEQDQLDAILIECAFPDSLGDLAALSHHLTPKGLVSELAKVQVDSSIYIINIKPAYYEKVVEEIGAINDSRIKILEIGREYNF